MKISTVITENMIEACLGAQRSRKIRRAFRHCKITIICLVLTVVVLRGTIGAGKFGTPEQDLNEIRERFYIYSRKREEPQRALGEAKRRTSSSDNSTTTKTALYSSRNHSDFDFKELLVDEVADVKPDSSKPYSLGTKISDWDEQRSKWLKENPNFPNFNGGNKPRVLLVTGSAPKACDNPVGDQYQLKSLKNKIDYCRLHGIEISYDMVLLDAEMAGFSAKLPLVRKLLLSHPEVEFVWWMDSDALFTDMAFEIPWGRYENHNLVMHGWHEMVYDQRNWIGFNTGSFLTRNCQWSLNILDTWASMVPKGNTRNEAGKIFSGDLKDRPVFKANDQSAMVYLPVTHKWGNQVYLEEMIKIYRPGVGDHRWPLMTHFVDCKTCGKFGDNPVERCLRQMDRAFNFADNQILQMYGSLRMSLARKPVKRVQNDTSNPLEVKDELGRLHQNFKTGESSSSS